MPHDLTIEVVDDTVRAVVSGHFSLDNAKRFFQRIVCVAREENVTRILIDAREITSEIPTAARFEFGTFMSEQDLVKIRVALVGRADTVWPDRFVENVANNRGAVVRVLTDVEEAVSWLTTCQHAPRIRCDVIQG